MCLPVKPYKVEREWKAFGLSCAVVQGREAGNRCGYVRVPPGHPYYGKDYDNVDVDVHGGLTFAELEPCTEHEDGQGYWFGFDCAHFGDASYDRSMKLEDCVTDAGRRRIEIEIEMKEKLGHDDDGDHFWLQREVEAETERLAEQLAEKAKAA